MKRRGFLASLAGLLALRKVPVGEAVIPVVAPPVIVPFSSIPGASPGDWIITITNPSPAFIAYYDLGAQESVRLWRSP